jgi:NADH:ubiquinone oxidoreductase subunit 2 (subunit N)
MGPFVADAVAALPAGILAAMGLVTLLMGRRVKSHSVPGLLCAIALLLAAATLGWQELGRDVPREQTALSAAAVPGANLTAGAGTFAPRRLFIDDRLARSAVWLALGLGLLSAATAADRGNRRAGHRFAILLFCLSGVLLAAIANNFVFAVIAMELASLPATLLLLIEQDVPNARSAAARSLALNLFALAAIVGGAVLIRLLSGTTNLDELRTALPYTVVSGHARTLKVSSAIVGEIGCVLLLAGLGIHLLAAPFQLASAEIFDGSHFWGVGLTAIFPRGAALLLMIRLLVEGPPRLQGSVQTLFTAVGFLTILIGSLLAISQTRIRRLLAYLVVFQSGLLLVSLAAACCERTRPAATPWLEFSLPGGIGSACWCFVIDSLALIGLLALFAWRETSDGPLYDVEYAAHAFHGYSLSSAAVCVLTACLAGVPPFGSFWPRLAILRSTLSISVPAEHGFLPHQNVDYVVVAFAAAIGLILLAAIALGFIKRVLLDDSDFPSIRVVGSTGVQSNMTARMTVAVGLLIALFVGALGGFPGPTSRVVTWGTAEERSVSSTRADQTGTEPSGKKAVRRRGRVLDDD